MKHRSNSAKNFLPAILAILIVGVVVAVYGLNRSSRPADAGPEAQEQIALATALLEQGDAAKALEALEALRGEDGDRPLSADTEILRLRALDQAAMNNELAEAAAAFLEAHPDSEHGTEAELLNLSARIATAGLANPLLLQSVDAFVQEHPDHPGTGRLKLALAQHELRIGDTEAASRRLSAALASPDLDRTVVREIQYELGDLNLQNLMQGMDGTSYTVASGDSVWAIASRHDVSEELLMRVNNISDPTRLRVGQTLTIPDTDFSLVCDVSRNELTLYNHGQFVKTYPVRTGRQPGTTPQGDFRILNKKTGPTWRPGDGRVYLPGDPNNELGTRWMAFEGDILGIHGTIHPETVGHYASNGCIGMTTKDVEELFDLILVGTSLKIVGEQDTNYARVIPAPDVPAPLTKAEIASLN